jgi:cytochrome b561
MPHSLFVGILMGIADARDERSDAAREERAWFTRSILSIYQSKNFCFSSINLLLVSRFRLSREKHMRWRNSSLHYGIISISLHWLAAVAVFGLFALGYWMVGLTYYSSWYKVAPDIHKSVGVLLFLLMAVRLSWRMLNPPPPALPEHGPLTRIASKLGHAFLYLGLFVLMISGYLISTADGRGISVFGWFEIPASLTSLPDQGDNSGLVHRYLAWTLVIFAILHGLAALKHHFIDHDRTLLRMFGR